MKSAIVALVALTCVACRIERTPRVAADAPLPDFDLQAFDIVDLSHALNGQTIFWPTSPDTFALESTASGETPGGYFYSANSFSMPEHGGTHFDAPSHFAERGQSTDEVPLDRLIAPAVVIDVTRQAAGDPDYRLTAADLAAWEAEYGIVPLRSIVLLRTGWSRHWPDRKKYLGDDTRGDASNLQFPSFGEDAARILVHDRQIAALGVDVASIDYGQSTDFIVHRLAAAANVPGLENLTSLDRLPATGAFIIALPIPIQGGSGGPMRVAALVPRQP